MKLLILLSLMSCTQKYVEYDLIRKVDFNKESYEHPVTVMQVIPTGKDEMKECFNQWLFFANAEKLKNTAIPYMVRSLCPSDNFLLNTSMTESWWTTIVFTRACVDIETSCGAEKRK